MSFKHVECGTLHKCCWMGFIGEDVAVLHGIFCCRVEGMYLNFDIVCIFPLYFLSLSLSLVFFLWGLLVRKL
jgi:hypothetical protein